MTISPGEKWDRGSAPVRVKSRDAFHQHFEPLSNASMAVCSSLKTAS